MAGLFRFARHEDALPRHQDVLEQYDARRLPVFAGEFGCRLTRPPGLARHDGDAIGVDRHGAADGEIGVLFRMRAARHDEKFVHIGGTCDDRLGARDDDAILPPLLDVDIGVAVFLLAGALRAVALGVRHGDAERQVAILRVVHIGEEALVIVGPVHVVGEPCRLEDAAESVMGEVALGASGYLAGEPHRFEFGEKVGGIPVDVHHAVHDPAGSMLARGHHLGVLGDVGEVVGDADGIDARPEDGRIRHAFDALAFDKDTRLVGAKRLAIVGGGHQHGAILQLSVPRLADKIEQR